MNKIIVSTLCYFKFNDFVFKIQTNYFKKGYTKKNQANLALSLII